MSPAPGELLTYLGPGMLSILNFILICTQALQFKVSPPPDPLSDAALGIGIAAAMPGFFNPQKLATDVLALVVAGLDVVMGFVAGAVMLVVAFESNP